MSDKATPYTAGASWLISEFGRLQMQQGRRYETTDIAAFLGVTTVTARRWLKGEGRPERPILANTVDRLGVKDARGEPDYSRAMQIWQYPPLSTKSPASIPELILYLRHNKPREWSQDYCRSIVNALRSVQNITSDWATMANDYAAKRNMRLETRAERIAQIVYASQQPAPFQQSNAAIA